MANQLDAVIPRILAQGLKTLRENAIMASLVNNDYSSEARRKGSTVDIPVPAKMGIAKNVEPSANYTQPDNTEFTYKSIELNKWKFQDFYMTDKDIAEIMNGATNLRVQEAARSLANAVDTDLLNLYKGVYNIAGTAGQTPFQREPNSGTIYNYHGLGASSEARKELNKNNCPRDLRRIVLDVESEANATALPQFTSASDSGSVQTIREAEIGRKLGFDWYLDQNVPTHTKVVATGTALTFNGDQDEGAEIITVAGCTVAPVEGDVFSLPGHKTTYTVKTGATTTSWGISPALEADVDDTTTITPIASHTVNLAFHRDAFAIAVRPLLDVEAGGNRIETFTDDVSGLTLRLEISRRNKETIWTFDILYGVALVRPECAVRILG
jgi:hypothetical protein